ncbi:MAG: phage tail sheath family protein [Flavobacteriales bacterium]|nr:phage tail sheath family protein [Flavobacteriales bacterium]MCB9448592.1 phage tail sheath family protein [Flavobacteriales bacterium]
MPEYKTPGVYVEEISTLPASIAPVATAIPVFIGYTAQALRNGEDITDVPTRVTSLLEFEQWFGGPKNETFVLRVKDTTVEDVDNPGTFLFSSREYEVTLPAESSYKLYYHMQMYFNNGGGPCYIVSVGSTSAGSPGKAALKDGLEKAEMEDEITLITIPEAVTLVDADIKELYDAALAQCNKLQDRFTIMDVIADNANTVKEDGDDFRDNNVGSTYLKYGAAYYPLLETTLNFAYDASALKVNRTVNGGYNAAQDFAGSVITLDASAANQDSLEDIRETATEAYGKLVTEIRKIKVEVYPCSSIAGTYARVDRDRGVWKAPANVSLRSVKEPAVLVSSDEQEDLNVDATSGKSINAIRTFAGKGVLVWGARTLAGNDNEWRYVPVRRLYIFVEESTKKATEFVVFEPNDANTWLKVKTMIENFLVKLWRDGALAGAKPEDAFFVKVGLGETMTALDILEGRMNIEIGMAAVRPAEFIILKFSHKLQES